MVESRSLQALPYEERYEIRQQLWFDGPHGGWLAFDRVLRREVILNIPYRSNDNGRFVDVAQLRARLRHANLVPIYDFSVTPESRPFFTEPHLQTHDLSQFDDGESTLWKQVRFLLQVCEALNFVHANELLHLDLKPENLLVTQPFEEVFLVRGHPSLPAAHMASENDNQLGATMGTPAYMAPEQADPARFGPATAATDVYGLGGILYYLLYSDSPNHADSTNIADVLGSLSKRNGPPSPGQLQFTDSPSRNLAKKLEPICLRALQTDRTERHQNVKEISEEIVAILMP